MSFMNRGMQNKRQKIAVVVIIGVVLVTFLMSIVVIAIG
jgi:hypothetical protein